MIAATSTAQEAGSLRVMHTLPIQDVYRMLGPSPEGLSHAEAAHRLQRCGRNSIRQVKGPSLVLKFLANFTHVMVLLLWLGGAIAVLAQLPQLGMAIWLVNCLNGAFSFWQEYKAEKATEALRRLLPTFARVLREGDMRHILAEELVPGDVCLLAEGEHISADCRVVQEAKLRVDQSTLTGEAHPVRKTAEAVLQTDLARADPAGPGAPAGHHPLEHATSRRGWVPLRFGALTRTPQHDGAGNRHCQRVESLRRVAYSPHAYPILIQSIQASSRVPQ